MYVSSLPAPKLVEKTVRFPSSVSAPNGAQFALVGDEGDAPPRDSHTPAPHPRHMFILVKGDVRVMGAHEFQIPVTGTHIPLA